jgi:hypothetical protein
MRRRWCRPRMCFPWCVLACVEIVPSEQIFQSFRSVAMWALKGDCARAVIHGLFWDPFDVAHAITESGQ